MKRRNAPLIFAVVICAISLAVMCFALTRKNTAAKTEFTPPPFDAAAVTGTPDVPEGLGWQMLDAKAYQVGICGRFTAEGQIWLTNPEENSVWLKVRVLDEKGNILGETGIIKPGEYLQSVTLDTVPKTGKPIVLKIMAYEPETYYSAGAVSLNTIVY